MTVALIVIGKRDQGKPPEVERLKTSKQALGQWGERYIVRSFACPQCKSPKSLRSLPVNFKCADIICDFCGYLAQVKTMSVPDIELPPQQVLGAAWGPQAKRMDAGIYFSLYIVLKSGHRTSVYFLPAELQTPHIFKKRSPLSASAKRAGWQGFMYDLGELDPGHLVRVYPAAAKRTQKTPSQRNH